MRSSARIVRRAAAIAKERGIAAAATGRSSTPTATPARRCSTSTCTCSADEAWLAAGVDRSRSFERFSRSRLSPPRGWHYIAAPAAPQESGRSESASRRARAARVRRGAAVQEHRAHAGSQRAFDVVRRLSPTITASAADTFDQLQRRAEDARVRLHQPCSDDDTAPAISPGARSATGTTPGSGASSKSARFAGRAPPARAAPAHVVVQLEVLAGRPLVVDLAGARVEPCPRPPICSMMWRV